MLARFRVEDGKYDSDVMEVMGQYPVRLARARARSAWRAWAECAAAPGIVAPRSQLLTLYPHSFVKGVQAGALVGSLLGVAKAASRKVRGRDARLVPTVLEYSSKGTLVGAIVNTFALTGFLLYHGFEPDALEDHAYRVNMNPRQKRMDQMSALGGCIGAAVGAFAADAPLGGGALGIAAGTLVYGMEHFSGKRISPWPPAADGEEGHSAPVRG